MGAWAKRVAFHWSCQYCQPALLPWQILNGFIFAYILSAGARRQQYEELEEMALVWHWHARRLFVPSALCHLLQH